MARQAPRHRAARPAWFGRGRTRALLSAGLLVGVGAVGTSAYWNDGGTVAGVGFSTGALHIDLPGFNQQRNENYAWTGFDLAGIPANGSRAATLVVSNHSLGNVPFSYRVKADATNTAGGNLVAALQVRVRLGGTVNGSGDAVTCTGGSAVGGTGTFNAFDELVGTTIAPGGSHTLCVEVSRTNTGVTAGSQATLTFTFPAKQEPS